MKKVLLFLFSILSTIQNAEADICVYINDVVSENAHNIIKEHDEIYEYCSICINATAKKIKVKDIKKGNPIYVNDTVLDLAHTYYKKGNKYINIGIESGCIREGENDILKELSNLSDIYRTKKTDKQQAKEEAQKIVQNCININQNNEKYITTDLQIEQNIKINDCLVDAIKREIETGFDIREQKEMFDYLMKAKESVFIFYSNIYSGNKYCYGTCGSISAILPYVDENNLLTEMLEKLKYLNIAKNGY